MFKLNNSPAADSALTGADGPHPLPAAGCTALYGIGTVAGIGASALTFLTMRPLTA